MKQTLKIIYNALLFKVKYFIWKHNRTNVNVKQFLQDEYSKKLIKESVKVITAQQEINKRNRLPPEDWVWYVGYIPHDWLDRINKKIEETKPDWVKDEEKE